MDIINSQKKKELNLMCQFHKEENIILIKVEDKKKNNDTLKLLYCCRCLSEGHIDGLFVNIKEIINSNGKEKIKNWPFFQSEQIQSLLGLELQEQSEKIQQINSFFDQFKVKIIKLIDELQKKTIISIEQNETNQLYEEMKTLSQLPKFIQILENNQTYNELQSQLQFFIDENKEKFKKFEQNFLQRKDYISFEKLQQNMNQIEASLIKQLSQQIEQMKNIKNDINKHLFQILDQLKFEKTTYRDSQEYSTIKEDGNDIQIQLKNQGIPQLVSSYILDQNLKYILRVGIKTEGSQFIPAIGLIRKQYKNCNHIYQENLCFYSSYGMTKVLKGSKLYSQKPQEIEIYISISENILMVSDYPNHENVNTLEDNNNNLQQFKNLLIGISQGNAINSTFNIKQFTVVDQAPIW